MRIRVWMSAMVLCAGCFNASSTNSAARLNKPAPALAGKATDGAEVSLAGLQGKVVVLDFWTTWCGPCRKLVPELKELVASQDGKPFALVGISCDEDLSKLTAYLGENPLPWTILHDGGQGPIAKSYGIEYYPSIFVIDKKGILRARDLHGKELKKKVEQLLNEA